MRVIGKVKPFLLLGCAVVSVSRAKVPAQGPPTNSGRTTPTPADGRYRLRILGVFDEDTGEPLEGVQVRDALSGTFSLTTKTGTVSLAFLPDGGSLVQVRKVGYEPQLIPIAIDSIDTVPLTVVLQRVVELSPVTVTASAPVYRSPALRGAQSRMNAHAGGYFIDEAAMRKWDNSTLLNAIVAKLPGLMVTSGPRGALNLTSSRSMCARAMSCLSPDCYPAVYIDGVPFRDMSAPNGSTRVDFSRMTTSDYAMAEFYPGGASIPVEFSSNTCGVLLLWSRER
jgi:hypothetical protein